jgi:hypothetical protein
MRFHCLAFLARLAVGLLDKRSYLAAALSATNLITIVVINLVTLMWCSSLA